MTTLELHNLAPEPHEVWRRMLRFVGWGHEERAAASRSVEPLFRRGTELVVETYNYLQHVPETAAILGWEQRVDDAHLEERRRFFTIWLARTLGLDTSDEFALYLFRAGGAHAGHGPRHIHTPSEYVIGSFGLVLASFSRFMQEAGLPASTIAAAMAAWSKYLAVQQHQLLFGYQVARELDAGDVAVRCALYGRLRALAGTPEIQVRIADGGSAGEVLRKLFSGYPQLRAEALERVWEADESSDRLWIEVTPAYVPRYGWRVLLNGRELAYAGGCAAVIHAGDEVAVFPPGR